MKVRLWAASLVLPMTGAAAAAGPVACTYNAPIERVWSTTEAVLDAIGKGL